jgi:serine beta-lactamase-like protein LACTB, mitochondrial
MHLSSRIAVCCLFTCLAVNSKSAKCEAQCAEEALQTVQQQTSIADPKYSKQIELARQAATEIFQHEMRGNSSSAINNKVARPPGISIAVAVDGKVVWAEGFGLADLEQCAPVLPRTKFRIGSTSKPLTAVGAALLFDQGRLDLDAPVQKYVPQFPDKEYFITTRELLGHLGGIRTYTREEESRPDCEIYHSVSESLKRFKDDPLSVPPGTKWLYSTYGYVLASAVIEGASGQDFLTFMRDKVFLPTGMKDTTGDEPEKIIPNRARGYSIRADGSYYNAPHEEVSYKWAGGGFLSTAEDLVRFGSALLHVGLLKQGTLEMMFSPQKLKNGEKTHYGLGWSLHEPGDRRAERWYEHSGGVSGSSSWLIIYPDQKVVVAWLQNSNDFRDWPVAEIAAPFFSNPK